MKLSVDRGSQAISMNIELGNRKIAIEGRIPRIAKLDQEWYEDIESPERLISDLRKFEPRPDILTFWQRLPELQRKYPYFMEVDSIAALPIKSYPFWLEKQIDAAARNKIRKAQKRGVIVKRATFDDEFVRGMASIFNETPIRQGRRFLHFGKNFETIKSQFSRFLFREELFGAYLDSELVGFIMLADAGRYAFLGQIISKVARRDLAPNNALLAKAVERCAEKGVPYLAYASWLDDGLGDFKRSNGFQRFDLPRYFVPLTQRGKLALSVRLHRGWKGAVPRRVRNRLKSLRPHWYNLRSRLIPLNKRDVGVGVVS
jgi:Acetyltransferase (GNAT) domain